MSQNSLSPLPWEDEQRTPLQPANNSPDVVASPVVYVPDTPSPPQPTRKHKRKAAVIVLDSPVDSPVPSPPQVHRSHLAKSSGANVPKKPSRLSLAPYVPVPGGLKPPAPIKRNKGKSPSVFLINEQDTGRTFVISSDEEDEVLKPVAGVSFFNPNVNNNNFRVAHTNANRVYVYTNNPNPRVGLTNYYSQE
jgi:hypothetical protein